MLNRKKNLLITKTVDEELPSCPRGGSLVATARAKVELSKSKKPPLLVWSSGLLRASYLITPVTCA